MHNFALHYGYCIIDNHFPNNTLQVHLNFDLLSASLDTPKHTWVVIYMKEWVQYTISVSTEHVATVSEESTHPVLKIKNGR